MADIIFNKKDYAILETLIERECFTPVSSLTIRQLIKITNMSLSKVRSVKDSFIMMEYISEGSKDGNNKTYYVTDKGVEHYKLAFGFDEENIDKMIKSFKNRNKGDE